MKLCSKVPAIHIFAVILGSLEIVLFGGKVLFGFCSVPVKGAMGEGPGGRGLGWGGANGGRCRTSVVLSSF